MAHFGGGTLKRVLAAAGFAATAVLAQQADTRSASRPASSTSAVERQDESITWFRDDATLASQVAGATRVEYGAPSWGGVGREWMKRPEWRWRLGRDAWTTLTTEIPIVLGGVAVAPGTYRLLVDRAKGPVYRLLLLTPKDLEGFSPSDVAAIPSGTSIPLRFHERGAVAAELRLSFEAADQSKAGARHRFEFTIAFGPYRLTAPGARADGSAPLDEGYSPVFVRAKSASKSATVDEAVARACEWLVVHQDPKGYWHPHFFVDRGDPALGPACDGRGTRLCRIALTAWSLRALMDSGSNHQNGRHADAVRRGLIWLLSSQVPKASGEYGGAFISDNVDDYEGHALAVHALAEARRATWSEPLSEPLQRGVDRLVARANNVVHGANVNPSDRNLSTIGFSTDALAAARAAGATVPEAAFERAVGFTSALQELETGRFGHSTKGERPPRPEGMYAMFPQEESELFTGLGMLTLMHGGRLPSANPELRLAADLLAKRPPRWDKSAGTIDLLYWHFGVAAIARAGPPHWAKWATATQNALTKSQRTDGNFRGSWDPIDPHGQWYGRVYMTAVAALTLKETTRGPYSVQPPPAPPKKK